MNIFRSVGLCAALFTLSSLPLTAQVQPAAPAANEAATPLPANARVAIIGDSITEQKLYSKFIETYLLACTGRTDIKCFQFGWSGETAVGFATREENDLNIFQPTVATFCYGMNDGGYTPYTDAIGAKYESAMRKVLTQATGLGVKVLAVGSPGAVDPQYFKRPYVTATQYNDSLAHLAAIDRKLAAELHTPFADVHQTMFDAMTKAKTALGADYDVGGRDGIHPQANGHLLMAAAFLKALGCNGNIGDITVDMKGAATASSGHTITKSSAGSASLESTTWPFCFDPDPSSSASTRSILPFCTFNQDLNRLTLRVKNLSSAKAKVTWGDTSKEFTQEQLTQGINLPAEFSTTPFCAPFRQLLAAVATKQAHETLMIRGMITHLRGFAAEAKEDPAFADAINTVKKKLLNKQEQLDAAQRRLLRPVKHEIKVEVL